MKWVNQYLEVYGKMKLNKEQITWFKDLTTMNGISGHEEKIASYLYNAYEPYADEIVYDNLGSIMAVKKSKNKDAKKVMILAHMDEIGFVIKDIKNNGVLTLRSVGGWFDQTLLSNRIDVINRHGEIFKGAIISKPPHMLTPTERQKPIAHTDMIVDIGATSKEEVLAQGIQIGDPIVCSGEFNVLMNDKRILAKAIDNRYGCVLGIDLLKSLQDVELDFDLYVGASVQEEVGLRGATTITHKIKPDFAIILDCSPANDAQNPNELGKLGEGVLLRMMDGSMIANKDYVYEFKDICDKHDIANQFYYSMGGTDAGIVHKSLDGVKTLTCCVVARNIHTPSSILDVDDYLSAKNGLIHFLQEAEWGDLLG